jgi:hypothetical protein
MSFLKNSVLSTIAIATSMNCASAFAQESFPFSSDMEVLVDPEFSRGSCPAALPLTGVGTLFKDHTTTSGKVDFANAATQLKMKSSSKSEVLWEANLLPQFAGCYARAYWGEYETSPLLAEFVNGKVFLTLNMEKFNPGTVAEVQMKDVLESYAVFQYSVAH